MTELSDEQFEKMISEAIDTLPARYIEHLNNVAITYADEPTAEQRKKLKLRANESLYGLYEGIPLTERGGNYSMVLPDKITIFKRPIVTFSPDLTSVKAQIKRTLWHEIAHFYGLNHNRIDELQNKKPLTG